MSVSTIYSMHVNKRFFPKQDHDEVLSEEETSHYIKSAMELISPKKNSFLLLYEVKSRFLFFIRSCRWEYAYYFDQYHWRAWSSKSSWISKLTFFQRFYKAFFSSYFPTWQKSQDQNINILRIKRPAKMK